jgi:hypothetical protein
MKREKVFPITQTSLNIKKVFIFDKFWRKISNGDVTIGTGLGGDYSFLHYFDLESVLNGSKRCFFEFISF